MTYLGKYQYQIQIKIYIYNTIRMAIVEDTSLDQIVIIVYHFTNIV